MLVVVTYLTEKEYSRKIKIILQILRSYHLLLFLRVIILQNKAKKANDKRIQKITNDEKNSSNVHTTPSYRSKNKNEESKELAINLNKNLVGDPVKNPIMLKGLIP